MPTTTNGRTYSLSGSENRPVVTLIHGLGMNHQMWRYFQSTLANQYQVLSTTFWATVGAIDPTNLFH